MLCVSSNVFLNCFSNHDRSRAAWPISFAFAVASIAIKSTTAGTIFNAGSFIVLPTVHGSEHGLIMALANYYYSD